MLWLATVYVVHRSSGWLWAAVLRRGGSVTDHVSSLLFHDRQIGDMGSNGYRLYAKVSLW